MSFIRLCLLAAVSLLTGSCVWGESELLLPVETAESDSESITLEFTMLTRNANSAGGSRSLLPPAATTETGFAAENYLDLDNLTFLLFDGSRKMLRTFKPEVKVIDDATTPYIKYSVRTFLHDRYFLDATSADITFTIVVMGNYAGLSPESFNYHIGQNLTEIFDQGAVGTFAIPIGNDAAGSWIPAIAPVAGQAARHIPMAGMQTFTVSTARLRASTPDRPYQLSDGSLPKYVNMLRALAKIEIVDKIESPQSLSIEKAELIGHTTRGSILPLFSQWNTTLETQYVTRPSVPAAARYVGADPVSGLHISPADDGAVLNFFLDTDATAARDDGARVFSCYITEYDPIYRGAAPGMWMRLSLTSPDTDDTALFRLEVAPYVDGRPGEPMPILRNNIYRYVITGVNDIDLDIQPFADMELSFGFGLMRDARGDLMVLPDKDGNYPAYFRDFLNSHDHPQELDETGNPTGNPIVLMDGDYYAIVTGESGDMSEAELWVKDKEGCRVLSNYGSVHDSQECSARRVESFFGNNESEKFLKDIFGYRRVYHFNNHNSIVRHPLIENLLFCYIENYRLENEERKYYEVESWDDATLTGWIINKDDEGTETGFQRITSDGTLGETIPID